MITIFFDVMGSDSGPKQALAAAADYWKFHTDVKFEFFGPKKELKKILDNLDLPAEVFRINDCSEVIQQTDGILDIRRKKKSSMVQALEQFKAFEDSDNGFVISAGSTASFVAGCIFILKLMPGFEKVGFMVFLPTAIYNKFTLMLDAGANLTNKAQDLYNYAVFATTYWQLVFNKPKPKVALLNVGTEPKKGSLMLQETYKALTTSPLINFSGNVEGREVLSGNYDVVVTDGYAGNICLKSMEGTFKALVNVLKKAIKKNIFRTIAALFCKKVFSDLKNTFDYKEYGGAIIAGSSKLAIKCHGSSDTQSFMSAIDIGYKSAKSKIIKNIQVKLANEEKFSKS